MIFSRKRKIPQIILKINENNSPATNSMFFLGIKFDRKLRWTEHIKYLVETCKKKLNVLRCLQSSAWGADRYSLILIYQAYIRSKMDYGCHLYNSACKTNLAKLDRI